MNWKDGFDERQLRLIQNCRDYEKNDPAGLPGHQLMLVVAQMARLMDGYSLLVDDLRTKLVSPPSEVDGV